MNDQSPAPSEEMEERLQRMRNAMETLDQQARPLASQWRIHAWTLMTLAESIAAERNDKFPALVLMVETLKRELAEAHRALEDAASDFNQLKRRNNELQTLLNGLSDDKENEDLRTKLAEVERIAEELAAENAKLQVELMSLSAAYQRQKEALKMVEEEVTPGVYSRNFWATIRSALAETPDVSLLGRVVSVLKETMKYANQHDIQELLSTLQPDHQK